MKLDQARKIVDFVVAEAPGAVSVFVADTHGEIVAAATMDGAAPDTRLNAQRKAYTAARSDATATSALAEKVKDDPVERASFDPFFTFFKGGVAVFDGDDARRRGRRQRAAGRGRRGPRAARDRRGRAGAPLELARGAVALVHRFVRPRGAIASPIISTLAPCSRSTWYSSFSGAAAGRHHDPVRVDLELRGPAA